MTTALIVSDPAPNFDLAVTDPAQPGSKQMVQLSNFSGQYLVLYFYPRDNTPGCTTQAVSFTEHLPAFKTANTAILGVSADSLASHEKFVAKQNLGIPLGSDEDLKVCKAYGVWVEKKMYGRTFMGIQRSTFLISPTGDIVHIWNKVKVKEHIEDILKTIQSAQ